VTILLTSFAGPSWWPGTPRTRLRNPVAGAGARCQSRYDERPIADERAELMMDAWRLGAPHRMQKEAEL
jgi:hypothetical protein